MDLPTILRRLRSHTIALNALNSPQVRNNITKAAFSKPLSYCTNHPTYEVNFVPLTSKILTRKTLWDTYEGVLDHNLQNKLQNKANEMGVDFKQEEQDSSNRKPDEDKVTED